MLTRTKLLLAGFAAAAAMLTLVANASARNYSVTEREYEITFSLLRITNRGVPIDCRFTQLGTYTERTFAKVQHSRIARARHTVLGAGMEECTGGRVTVLNETLPWEVDYESFRGTLPRFTSMRVSVIGLALRIVTEGLSCLLSTTSTKPAFGEYSVNSETGANSGTVEGFRFDERIGIPLGGGFMCELAGEATLEGTGTVRNLARTNALRFSLI